MRIPIQYALTYPRRVPSPAQAVSLAEVAALTFEPVDEARFPAFAIARHAGDLLPPATAASSRPTRWRSNASWPDR